MKFIKHNIEKDTNPKKTKINADLSTVLIISIDDINNYNNTDISHFKDYTISTLLLPSKIIIDKELEEKFYEGELWKDLNTHLNENTKIIHY